LVEANGLFFKKKLISPLRPSFDENIPTLTRKLIFLVRHYFKVSKIALINMRWLNGGAGCRAILKKNKLTN